MRNRFRKTLCISRCKQTAKPKRNEKMKCCMCSELSEERVGNYFGSGGGKVMCLECQKETKERLARVNQKATKECQESVDQYLYRDIAILPLFTTGRF